MLVRIRRLKTNALQNFETQPCYMAECLLLNNYNEFVFPPKKLIFSCENYPPKFVISFCWTNGIFYDPHLTTFFLNLLQIIWLNTTASLNIKIWKRKFYISVSSMLQNLNLNLMLKLVNSVFSMVRFIEFILLKD